MNRFLALAALAVGMTLSISTASFAATCKANITVSGNGAITQNGAEKKAVTAWKQQAISNYGVFYGDEKAANDGKGTEFKRCARSQLGLMICEITGRPCEAGAPSEPVGKQAIACTEDEKDNGCEPDIKWLQKRLNDKNDAKLKVDGKFGKGTTAAIKDFQKASKGLSVTGLVDEALLKALE